MKGLFNDSKIYNWWKGIRKHHRGFIWKYDNDDELLIKPIILGEKSVIQYDKKNNELNIFLSIKDASDKTGVLSPNICSCCRGKTKSAGGFVWKYKQTTK